MKGSAYICMMFLLTCMYAAGDAYYPERPAPQEAVTEEIPLPKLIELTAADDAEELEHLLLFEQPDVNITDHNGRSALHYAAEAGADELVKLLLRYGADVQLKDDFGFLPLHLSYPQFPQTALKLSSRGSLLFFPEPSGLSLVQHALKSGAETFASLVGEDYANTSDPEGRSMLHYAAAHGDPESVEYLLSAHAHVNAADQKGLIPLDEALAHTLSTTHADTAVLLISRGSAGPSDTEFLYAYQALKSDHLDQRFHQGASSLHLAAEKNHLALLKHFLASGVSPDLRDDQQKTPLHRAAKHDQNGTARTLIDAHAQVSLQDKHGRTPLHDAVQQDASPELLAMLLTSHSYPALPDNSGLTALHLASMLPGREQAAKLLLAYEAEPDARDHIGRTALMLAVETRSRTKSMMLLDHGSSIFHRANDGSSAASMMVTAGPEVLSWAESADLLLLEDDQLSTLLHYAAAMDVPSETLQYLFDSGLPADSVNILGESPLHLAMKAGRSEAARLLIANHADPYRRTHAGQSVFDLAFSQGREFTESVLTPELASSVGPEGITPVHLAVSAQLPEITALLLDFGADVNAQNYRGTTPLHIAARGESISLLQALMRYRADLSARDQAGNTPLHEAVLWNSFMATRFFLLSQASPQTRNLAGDSPLHTAVQLQSEAVIRSLAEFSAPLNPRNASGRTPLLSALQYNLPDIAVLLIELGADIHVRDSDGNTPLHKAVWNLDRQTAELLVRQGADIHTKNRLQQSPFLSALSLGAEPVRWLTETGSIMVRDNAGNTPLHLAAARHASPEILRNLIQGGAQVNTMNNNLDTPMHLAVYHTSQHAVRLLASSGADLFIPNSDGITPLDTAVRKGVRVLAWIIDETGIDREDPSGNTLLHAAVQSGSMEAVRYFIDLGADPKKTNHAGISPADLAAELEHDEISELFSAE